MPNSGDRRGKIVKAINQSSKIVFTNQDLVYNDDKTKIYKYTYNGYTRYYVMIRDVLANHCKLCASGTIKFQYYNGFLYFPEVLYASTNEPHSYENLYIEITMNAFNKGKFYRLHGNETLLKYLQDMINGQPQKDVANIVKETKQTESVVEEEVIVKGQLPINYNELIESLQLKDTYGKFSSDIEENIKKAFNNAEFKIQVPVKVVEKVVEKQSELIDSVKSKFTNAAKELLEVYGMFYPRQKCNEQSQQYNEQLQQCNEQPQKVQAETQNDTAFIKPENINEFVKAMSDAIIEKITRTYKCVPGGFIVERCKQQAYNLTLNSNADDHNSMWTLENASQIERACLNIMLALFFVNLIYHRNADYDVPKGTIMHLPEPSYVDNKKDYIAFIAFENVYQGFINSNDYAGILRNNIAKLIPSISIQSVTRESYMNIALALQNYLNQIGFKYVRVITER